MALPQIDIDGIKMLTEYKPAVNNLFSVYIFDSETGSGDTLSNYSPYHATGFTFGEETFDFKRHPVSKVMFLGSEGLKRVDEFYITWRESDGYKIKKLHMEWLDLFYDTTTDKYRSIPLNNGSKDEDEIAKRYKTIRVEVRSSDDPKQSTKFTFKCLPYNIGNLHLAWGTTPSVVTYTINYYVEDWKME